MVCFSAMGLLWVAVCGCVLDYTFRLHVYNSLVDCNFSLDRMLVGWCILWCELWVFVWFDCF